tara:strand:- start:595 stop:1641 length:1047 start_codon:yes stop_codon:yes gene_type:complete
MDLRNGDCLEVMKELENDSIDLLFADLPYGQTSCKWDCLIDLDLFWKEVNRVCKPDAPMVFTCSVKFGNTLINSNPKNFRYDLIWVKSAPCGFLNAKKMPMKKHEMIYVFYNKIPKVYTENIALHHKHKFLNSKNGMKGQDDLIYGQAVKQVQNKKYDPPLPNSVIKETNHENAYNTEKRKKPIVRSKPNQYETPLPNSVIKEDTGIYNECDHSSSKTFIRGKKNKTTNEDVYKSDERFNNGKLYHHSRKLQKGDESIYEPPLPNSILEVKSQKGKHATQKPVALMEWILKYYSREGGVILDPTMGSGSMGVACLNKNRSFIGIEKDETIYKVAVERCGLYENMEIEK